jgi:hypothetical protein
MLAHDAERMLRKLFELAPGQSGSGNEVRSRY